MKEQIGEWLISQYVTAVKKKKTEEAYFLISLIIKYGKEFDSPTLKDEALKRIGVDDTPVSPVGELVSSLFSELDRERGYKTTSRSAEAASMQRMLRKGYTPYQIMEAWKELKKDKFWRSKELFMMSVEKQIGAMLKGNPDPGIKYKKQKFSHLVRR